MIRGMCSFLRLEEMWRGVRFWRFFPDVHVGQGPHSSEALKCLRRTERPEWEGSSRTQYTHMSINIEKVVNSCFVTRMVEQEWLDMARVLDADIYQQCRWVIDFRDDNPNIFQTRDAYFKITCTEEGGDFL